MAFFNTFFKDTRKVFTCIAAVATLLFTYGTHCLDFLINYKFIAFQGGEIFSPIMLNHQKILIGIIIADVLGLAITFLLLYTKNIQPNWIWLFVSFFILLITLGLFNLTRPQPWYNFIFILVFLYLIAWFAIKFTINSTKIYLNQNFK